MERLILVGQNGKVQAKSRSGHSLPPYMSKMNERAVVASPLVPSVAPPPVAIQSSIPTQAWVGMGEAARMLGYTYFWLAHNWRRLGLHPSDFSRRRRLFEVAEIQECLKKNRFSYKGRPRKK